MRQSIRLKLTLLFLLTIILPIVVIVVELPAYYVTSIKEQQSSLMAGTLAALTSHIETYLDDLDRMTVTPYFYDDVMRALKLKSTYGWNLLTDYERYEAGQTLSTTLPNALKNTRKDILGTILLPMDGSVYVSSTSNLTGAVEGYPFEKQDWYIQALRADGDVAFISVHEQDYLNGARANVFSVARLIKDPDSRRPLGVIMADADTVAIERMIMGIGLKRGALAAILDDKGKLIYASGPIPDEVRAQLAKGHGIVRAANDDYNVVSKTVTRSKWGLYVLFPESAVKRKLDRVYEVGFGFAGGGIVVAVILYAAVSHWMVTPFKRMVQTMKRVQRGDMTAFYPVKGSDEVAQLGANLNTMISRLGELIDREYRAVLGRRNAEFHALQSQIQPHFLYNTLNGFIGLNRAGQRALLERAILSLSGMLRYTLEKNDRASLREEMAFVEQYCELQQMRFADKLELDIDLAPGVQDMLLPKLLLQPLVENAVIHGVEPSAAPCLLTIRADVEAPGEPDAACLCIQVSDDGVGFEPGEGRSGVGLTNVRERLMLAYGQASMLVQSKPGLGTTVKLRIPLKDVVRA
ncbi:cache domain-containing sensor histidine kinase [Paenibacillus glycinis]|uniref:histidine kinase n=1 Tax=Paenibacillus glycinis TaxID=2697035 RepID=A0ABW9XLK7_9BACL|nr:sensor histidine kinase [Paenibacillus glycinis]NBD23337.1 HAMP domain-containing protein [Paenibacillus glycinis]